MFLIFYKPDVNILIYDSVLKCEDISQFTGNPREQSVTCSYNPLRVLFTGLLVKPTNQPKQNEGSNL